MSGGYTTRNAELSEAVDVYANHDPNGVDILHEYFVPHAQLGEFLRLSRPIFEASACDLLNVTVRDVRLDEDVFLRYADADVFGLVLLFHQKLTPEAELAMGQLTRELIDVAAALGGRYYLPYGVTRPASNSSVVIPWLQSFSRPNAATIRTSCFRTGST